MKKIPTLFKRIYENHKIVGITDEITEGCEIWADPECVATVKYDGSCCAIIDGQLYKRYDAKKGKKPPAGAIPCCDPDPVTGHWPHWVKCNREDPADKWFWEALDKSTIDFAKECGGTVTFEAIGKHFNGNPYNLEDDCMIPHGQVLAQVEKNFESVKNWLTEYPAEGIVFWYRGKPLCKIKRTDFGLEWPIKDFGLEWQKA